MKSEKPTSQAEPSEVEVAKPSDVALVHAVTDDGAVHVIRRRGERLEAGALKPLREGAPIQGEVVSLRPREGSPLLCDVEVHYSPPAQPGAATAKSSSKPGRARRKGPAQVATDSYRDNWDSIWSSKKSGALN